MWVCGWLRAAKGAWESGSRVLLPPGTLGATELGVYLRPCGTRALGLNSQFPPSILSPLPFASSPCYSLALTSPPQNTTSCPSSTLSTWESNFTPWMSENRVYKQLSYKWGTESTSGNVLLNFRGWQSSMGFSKGEQRIKCRSWSEPSMLLLRCFHSDSWLSSRREGNAWFLSVFWHLIQSGLSTHSVKLGERIARLAQGLRGSTSSHPLPGTKSVDIGSFPSSPQGSPRA